MRRFRNDEILPREEDERPQHEHLVHERVDHPPERPFDFPQSGQIAVKKIGHQGDDVYDERAVEQPGVAAPLVLIEREQHEEDHCQQQPAAGQRVGDVAEHEAADCTDRE